MVDCIETASPSQIPQPPSKYNIKRFFLLKNQFFLYHCRIENHWSDAINPGQFINQIIQH